jgi:hypothetical protein
MGDENGDQETKCNSFGNGREKIWVGLSYYIPETNSGQGGDMISSFETGVFHSSPL